LSQTFTETFGWDTNMHTRNLMLDTLEHAIRERSLTLRSERTLHELQAFVYAEKKKSQIGLEPESKKAGARSGENDDLVMSLAMGVTVFTQLPRTLRREVAEPVHHAAFGATGY
jgi:hypothetical protein